MPHHQRVHVIFEEFVASLSDLIKVKVSEAVQTATSDFLASKLMTIPTAKVAEPVCRRRRRRGQKKVAGNVTLSKTGKRIGRPPKAKG